MPSSQGRLQPRRSRRCTASGLAATLEMGALFLQLQPSTPNVRLTPNLAKAGFNVPGNRQS